MRNILFLIGGCIFSWLLGFFIVGDLLMGCVFGFGAKFFSC